ncbi:MAG: NCS2 family permease [Candidatus Aureabacteria bacterium]|nr:NCS2 family permease [Candidatus Auribacterota bacterium]
MDFLEKRFHLSKNNTTVRTEIVAGITTFLTMAYIIILQPLVLTGRLNLMETGMDFGAVAFATCVSAALATLIMGLHANYPIAQAPGMGENFFFVLTVIPAVAAAGVKDPWKVSLGIVFVSGILFLLITLFNLREVVINAISPSMKNAIAVGIGLFIAFIGLQNARIVVDSPGTLLSLTKDFASPEILVFLFGLIVTSVLHVRRVKGSILIGILSSTALCLVAGGLSRIVPVGYLKLFADKVTVPEGFFFLSLPPNPAQTFLKMDVLGALRLSFVPLIIVFLFMDVFDTIGTFIGVAEHMGVVKDNKIPRIKKALLSDAVGTAVGAVFGTSTVTSYIESSTGVEQGGRTGLTAVTVSALFVLALFFEPVIKIIAQFPPITAPALVIVGAMMIKNVSKVDWHDYTEAIPSFLILLAIPLTYSISDGLAFGLVLYPVIKLFSGKGREINWVSYLLAVLFVARYLM